MLVNAAMLANTLATSVSSGPLASLPSLTIVTNCFDEEAIVVGFDALL
jgi:hypothetical protein